MMKASDKACNPSPPTPDPVHHDIDAQGHVLRKGGRPRRDLPRPCHQQLKDAHARSGGRRRSMSMDRESYSLSVFLGAGARIGVVSDKNAGPLAAVSVMTISASRGGVARAGR